MRRIGIVGCGLIGRTHSYCLRLLASRGLVDGSVAACHDADRGRAVNLARYHDAEVCGSVDDVVASCDVVWVCTWTSAHADVVHRAADAGRAVFCEKPLAPTLDAALDVARILRRVPHQVGLVLRFAPVFDRLRGLVRSGRYGDVLTAVMRDDQYFPIQGIYDSNWRADATIAGGGTLLEHSIHDVDILQSLLGEVREVRANVASRFGHPGIDDVATVTMRFESGADASLTSVWHQVRSRGSTRRLEVFCERAMLWCDDDNLGPAHVHDDDGESVLAAQPPAWAQPLLDDGVRPGAVLYAAQAKAFLDALDAGSPGAPDAGAALGAHEVVDAAYRSSANGGAPVAVGGR